MYLQLARRILLLRDSTLIQHVNSIFIPSTTSPSLFLRKDFMNFPATQVRNNTLDTSLLLLYSQITTNHFFAHKTHLYHIDNSNSFLINLPASSPTFSNLHCMFTFSDFPMLPYSGTVRYSNSHPNLSLLNVSPPLPY